MTFPSDELSDAALDALIARERARVVAPLTEWQAIAAQLREEGVLSAADATAGATRRPGVSIPARRPAFMVWSARVAAGAVLLVGGILIGRGQGVAGIGATPTATVAQRDTSGASVESHATPTFASSADARRALLKSQSEYQRAAAYLAASDTSAQLGGTPELYRERLAALDRVMSATQQALKASPQDPLLNQYYQSTVGAREATVQQLTQTIPVGARVSHF